MGETKPKRKPANWKTPETQSFLDTEDAVVVAFEELTSLEEAMYSRIARHMTPRYRYDQELTQMLLRREMASSPEWNRAWQKFVDAIHSAREAARLFREEIEAAVKRKP